MTRRDLTPLASLITLRVVATAVGVALGFYAISDDDFARVVIAQSFAESPSGDPSGSSWLPFPFWLNGSAMLLLGRHFWVARGVSLALSLASICGVYFIARSLALSRVQAWVAASIAALLPHSVWLGYATVPELFSATACLGAAATTVASSPRARLLGAVLVLCATLSRYESWSVALVVGALNGWDAVRDKRSAFLLPAALCALGPVAWMLHGIIHHDSATFFVTRVVDYKRMLGRGSQDLVAAIVQYPKLIVTGEPELALAVGAALLGVRRLPRTFARPLWAGFLLLAFLVYGNVRDGAPTHHPERPLLMIWLLLCLVGGALLPTLWQRPKRWIGILSACLALGLWVRAWWSSRDGFVDRRDEIAFGRMLRTHLPRSSRLLISVGDYGYFAVIAGFETPSRAEGIADIDPRQQQATGGSAGERLLRRARELGSTHIVVPSGRSFPQLGELELQAHGLALLRVRSD